MVFLSGPRGGSLSRPCTALVSIGIKSKFLTGAHQACLCLGRCCFCCLSHAYLHPHSERICAEPLSVPWALSFNPSLTCGVCWALHSTVPHPPGCLHASLSWLILLLLVDNVSLSSPKLVWLPESGLDSFLIYHQAHYTDHYHLIAYFFLFSTQMMNYLKRHLHLISHFLSWRLGFQVRDK